MAEVSEREEFLAEMVRSNELMAREAELLEAFLARVNPAAASTSADDEAETKVRKAKPKKREVTPKQAAARALSADEKYEVASAELEVLGAELEKARTKGEKEMDDLRALIDETELHIGEVKKATYEFKRDIVMGGENARTGKIMAERVVRYMEAVVEDQAVTVEKLRLKNSTLKAAMHKMEAQLAQKEEMGEILHVIDFDQLKIENQQYLEKIEERNNELLRLKLTTGKTVQVLNTLKKRLAALTAQGAWLRQEEADKAATVAKFAADLDRVEAERAAAEKLLRALRQEQEDPDQPQVLDYVRLKAEVLELEKKSADWERKLEIADMEVRRVRSHTRQVSRAAAAALPAVGKSGSLSGQLPTTRF